ncbi:hypothetical protein BH09GEM1_BH09GEM1_10730 [soil metagenome]
MFGHARATNGRLQVMSSPGQRVATDSAQPVAAAAHAIIGPRANAALDTGNALYRKKQYAAALIHYREAAELAPQHAAPFFGIYMVARATGNAGMNRLASRQQHDHRIQYRRALRPVWRKRHRTLLRRLWRGLT